MKITLMRIFLIICIIYGSASIALCQHTTPEEYIAKYKKLAISEMRRAGVPAAITLAQGLLESESGNSELLKASNNHFGIKCKSTWDGPFVKHTDDRKDECFRAYDNAEASYQDHSDFLRGNSRYAFLFQLEPTDYKDWAHGLKKAGYATNPRYADILIKNIEKYNLEQYTIDGTLPDFNSPEYSDYANGDEIAPSSFPGANRQHKSGIKNNNNQLNTNPDSQQPVYQILQKVTINDRKALQVPANTSLLSLAMKFHIRLSKLLEINDLQSDGLLPYSQIIFLEKKKTEGDELFALARKGESLYQIGQQYGIQLSSLCTYNGCSANQQFSDADTVFLKMPSGPQSKKLRQQEISDNTNEPSNSKSHKFVLPQKGISFSKGHSVKESD